MYVRNFLTSFPPVPTTASLCVVVPPLVDTIRFV